jgi:tRNA (guanine-N7-)-methyltransferase
MRLRNLKHGQEILAGAKYLIDDPKIHKGTWNKVFNNSNPTYLEIGMGKGKFILENALKYPDINFIGLEKYNQALARAIKKIDEYELVNLKLVNADAKNILDIFNHEIDRIYLNFSDPWPKERQSKRRLTSEIFLSQYENIFRDRKEIYLKTDNKDLFDYSIKMLRSYKYNVRSNYYDDYNEYDDIKTEYEEKFIENGNYIYKLEALKN